MKFTIKFWCLFIPALLISNTNCAQEANPELLGIQALQALQYSELLRVTLKRDCNYKLELANNPICPKLDTVNNEIIDKLALPYFNNHVSSNAARKIIVFWNEPKAIELSVKIIAGLNDGIVPVFNESELDLMYSFERSPEGIEAREFANDTEASVGILKSIIEY